MSLSAHARGAALRVSRGALALAQPHGWPAMRAGVDPAKLLRYREIETVHRLSLRTILYVGANRGQELPLLLHAFPAAHIHCFEPARTAFDELVRRWGSNPRCSVHQLALGADVGRAVLHESGTHDEANSLRSPGRSMSEQFPGVGAWTESAVDVSTLDAWASRVPLEHDVLLKMDVQGAEDLVLTGGAAQLAGIAAVIAEVAVTPTYEGALDAATMLSLLAAHGFGYGGQLDVVRSPVTNQVVEYDALFVRRNRP